MPTQESLNQFINDTINCDRPFTIGSTCVAEIARNVFVLLVQIELNARGRELEEVIVMRISPALATELIPLIGRCRIVCPDEIPTPAPGRRVNLICAFVFDGNVFLVFDVETNRRNELVLVRVPLCTVIG